MANGSQIQDGSRLWYKGNDMPNGRPAEFDEDAGFALQDLSNTSPQSTKDTRFAYCNADIDPLSNALGIPWETTKTVPFSPCIPYLGFTWDLKMQTVTLSEEKKAKYINAIEEWRSHPKHTLGEMEKLYVKLLHNCLAVPKGWASLTNLKAML